VLAGPIVNALSYRWLFWLPMVLTMAAAVAAHFLVPESQNKTSGRISWPPAVLLSAWLVALLIALSEAPVWGWGSGKVIGLIVAAVVLAAAWIEVERRSAVPLIDMKMMRRKAVWTNNLVALLFGAGMYASFAFLPEFVQTPASSGYGFGASITQSGLILLPLTVMMFLVGLVTNRLTGVLGGKIVVLLGSLSGVVGMGLVAFVHGEQWELYIWTAIMGIGFGLAYAAMSSLIVASVPPEQTGVASGMNANIRTIGGSVGAALMSSIVTAAIGRGGLPKESGYTNGFAVLTLAFLLAAVAAVLIPTVRRSGWVVRSDEEPEHPEMAIVAGGTVVGDKPE
jgi:predicted MFS family arabinose efflux permease